jgi:hypothetical protein
MRAMNQNTFMRMSDANGLKEGKGAGGMEGMETCGAMEEICFDI